MPSATPQNSESGTQLDKILEHLDSMHKRQDESDTKMNKRLDALEANERERKDASARKDAEEKSAAEEKARADAKRKDDDDKERKDAEEKSAAEEKERADAKRKDAEEKEKEENDRKDSLSVKSLHDEVMELRARMDGHADPKTRAAFVSAQEKAGTVARAFGDEAPRWAHGETLLQYRKRLLAKYQGFSPSYKDTDIANDVGDSVLTPIENQVYADAMSAAMNPASGDVPMLRAVNERDRTGRVITRFYGSPEACWGQFKMPQRALVGVTKRFE